MLTCPADLVLRGDSQEVKPYCPFHITGGMSHSYRCFSAKEQPPRSSHFILVVHTTGGVIPGYRLLRHSGQTSIYLHSPYVAVLHRKMTKSQPYTVEPQLSEPNGRHTIRLDNLCVWIDEGYRNSPSIGYQVGDNRRYIVLCATFTRG